MKEFERKEVFVLKKQYITGKMIPSFDREIICYCDENGNVLAQNDAMGNFCIERMLFFAQWCIDNNKPVSINSFYQWDEFKDELFREKLLSPKELEDINRYGIFLKKPMNELERINLNGSSIKTIVDYQKHKLKEHLLTLKFREKRESKGLSLEDVGEAINCSIQHVEELETGDIREFDFIPILLKLQDFYNDK